MKFKHLLLTASVMALFSSCSNDELVSENTSHGDAIAFSVTTTNATRAADYWCNNQLPKYFEVSASYDDAIYFQDEVYKQENTSTTYLQNDGNYRYWPNIESGKAVSIYAYKVKADGKDAIGSKFATFSWTDATAAPTITLDMLEAENNKNAASAQHDLIYAYTQVKTKPDYNTTTPINFRHALSQIVFYAQCQNSKICVEIEEISLMNAASKGVFTLPSGDNYTNLPNDETIKNGNLNDHTQNGSALDKGLGTWALTYQESNNLYYAYTADCKVNGNLVKLDSGVESTAWKNLTDNKNEAGKHSEYDKSLLVLPQTDYTKGGTVTGVPNNNVAAYAPKKTDGTYQPLSTAGGACIAIKCKIRNIAGTSVADDDVYLWGSKDAAADLVVPVDFAWEQGKKYIYRINFSKTGHGGYNPGDGHEVLVPIQLSVTVDDFAKVDDIIENI